MKIDEKWESVNMLLLMASILGLLTASLLEYYWGYLPCKLCWYERFAYFGVAGFGTLSMLAHAPMMIYLSLGCWMLSIAIFLYHLGVEHGIFIMSDCGVTELMLSCSMPMPLLGLSLATWGLLYSLIVLGLALLRILRSQ